MEQKQSFQQMMLNWASTCQKKKKEEEFKTDFTIFTKINQNS